MRTACHNTDLMSSVDTTENAHTFPLAWPTAQRMNHNQTPAPLGAGSTTQYLREPEGSHAGRLKLDLPNTPP